MLNEYKVSDGTLPLSDKGEPAIATGLNGVGKLMSPNVTVGEPPRDGGKTASDGKNTIH